jgi:hypothetical protein
LSMGCFKRFSKKTVWGMIWDNRLKILLMHGHIYSNANLGRVKRECNFTN